MHVADFLPNFHDMPMAYAMSLPIGWNREQQGRSAGLLTFPVAAVASCGFILAGRQAFAHAPDELGRILQGLIAGIGFIGGGAILKLRDVVRGTADRTSDAHIV